MPKRAVQGNQETTENFIQSEGNRLKDPGPGESSRWEWLFSKLLIHPLQAALSIRPATRGGTFPIGFMRYWALRVCPTRADFRGLALSRLRGKLETRLRLKPFMFIIWIYDFPREGPPPRSLYLLDLVSQLLHHFDNFRIFKSVVSWKSFDPLPL